MGAVNVQIATGRIINQKSRTGYSDNDWLLVSWITPDSSRTSQGQLFKDPIGDYPHVLHSGDVLLSRSAFEHYEDSTPVVATVTVVNLASLPPDAQPAVAEQFARRIYDWTVERLIEYGEAAWAQAGLKWMFDQAGKLGGPELQKFFDDVADWVRGAIRDATDWFWDTLVDLLDGRRENCDGVVLSETFGFAPNMPRQQRLTRTYVGSQSNEDCGSAPRTEITWLLERDALAYQDYPALHREKVPGQVWTIKRRPANIKGYQASLKPDLVWFNHQQNPAAPTAWDGGRTLGWNWDLPTILPGLPGRLYTIDGAGSLNWRYDKLFRDGRASWTESLEVGWGWAGDDIVGVMAESFPDAGPDGRILGNGAMPLGFYVLRTDGGLDWYVHLGARTGSPEWANGGLPHRLGGEWRDGNRLIFSGGGGVLYVIKKNGSLRWIQHDGNGGMKGGHQIGEGWASFLDVFSTGEGNIYGVDQDGTLWWYRYSEWASGSTGGWLGREAVGSEWDKARVLANRIWVR